VTASELSSRGGRARSHRTRDSTGAHLDREARSGAEKHMAVPELNSARKVIYRAAGHVEVPELTSIGRRGPELQGTWQRVDAHSAPCLNLKLVYGGIRSAGYRQCGISTNEIHRVKRIQVVIWDYF
jgi:hypothetical protein